jgi:hypothetical protein
VGNDAPTDPGADPDPLLCAFCAFSRFHVRHLVRRRLGAGGCIAIRRKPLISMIVPVNSEPLLGQYEQDFPERSGAFPSSCQSCSSCLSSVSILGRRYNAGCGPDRGNLRQIAVTCSGRFLAYQNCLGQDRAVESACPGNTSVRHILTVGEVAEWFNAHAWKM